MRDFLRSRDREESVRRDRSIFPTTLGLSNFGTSVLYVSETSALMFFEIRFFDCLADESASCGVDAAGVDAAVVDAAGTALATGLPRRWRSNRSFILLANVWSFRSLCCGARPSVSIMSCPALWNASILLCSSHRMVQTSSQYFSAELLLRLGIALVVITRLRAYRR